MARKKQPAEEEIDYPVELIGYARVSTLDQSLEQQLQALRACGVKEENLYQDQLSALSARRRGWELCKKALRRGDTLVVYALSRLGRDIRHLLDINKMLLEEGVTLKSLTEPIDTSTADGKLLFTVRAAFAQFERDITIERTRAGIKARTDAGLPIGRPRSFTDKQMAGIERDLVAGKLTLKEISEKWKVPRPTIKYHFRKPRIAYMKQKPKGK